MTLTPEKLSQNVHWWELAGHDPAKLNEAWRLTHHAAQPLAEVGKAFAVPSPDDSHTNLEWFHGNNLIQGYLAGVVVESPKGDHLRAALRMIDLHAFLIRPSGEAVGAMELRGATSEQAHQWIVDAAMNALDAPIRQATEPAPDLPDHPVASGAPFGEPDQMSQAELIRLYANTDGVLTVLKSLVPETSEARCWPHHFDLATLTEVARGDDGNATRTIGVGLTPPDSLSPEGYWYVSPWSADRIAKGERADLPYGRWIDRGEGVPPMALLPISEVAGPQDPKEELARCAGFIAAAFNEATQMIRVS
ncbi:MAG: hypothetical protein AAGG07_05575 [Planctomycetota bacterium]